MPKNQNFYLLNDEVVKKLFKSGSDVSNDFIFRIISYVTKKSLDDLEKDFEFVRPQVVIDKKVLKTKTDIVLETNDAYYAFDFNYGSSDDEKYPDIYIMFLSRAMSSKPFKAIYSINFDSFDYFHDNRLIYRSKMIETEFYKKTDLKIVYIDINLEYLRKLNHNDIKKQDSLTKALYLFVCNDEEFLNELYDKDEFMKKLQQQVKKIAQDFDLSMGYDKEKLN